MIILFQLHESVSADKTFLYLLIYELKKSEPLNEERILAVSTKEVC